MMPGLIIFFTLVDSESFTIWFRVYLNHGNFPPKHLANLLYIADDVYSKINSPITIALSWKHLKLFLVSIFISSIVSLKNLISLIRFWFKIVQWTQKKVGHFSKKVGHHPKKVGHHPKNSWTFPKKYVRHYLKYTLLFKIIFYHKIEFWTLPRRSRRSSIFYQILRRRLPHPQPIPIKQVLNPIRK